MIDAARLRQLPNVIAVASIRHTERREKAERGSFKAQEIQITCVDENYWLTIAPYLETGRLIDASDVAKQAKVCVLPRDVRSELFGPEDSLGKTVTVRGYPYTVIGTLGGPQNPEVSRSMFVPLSLSSHHLGHVRQFVRMNIRVDHPENSREVKDQAEALLKMSRPEFARGVFVQYHSSRLDRVNFIRFIVRIFVYIALAAVFILGKIGLTNVMLGAITERRREIGLRKAVGATDSVIRTQFVLESLIVSLGSGIIGAVIGVFAVFILRLTFRALF